MAVEAVRYRVMSDDEETSSNPAVLSLSKFAQDRIEQLPESCLPEPGRYNPKKSGKPNKKKKNAEASVSNGLKEAVC